MTYVTIRDGQIVGPEMWGLPVSAPRLDGTGTITPPDRQWTPADLAACGITEVTPATRPADTATSTSDRTVTLVAGQPVETWTPRPLTVDEQAIRTHAAARAALRNDIITKAITWLEADSATAQTRATAISNAVTTVQTRRGQVQSFTFNGSTVAGINTQLNNSLKPLLIDLLDYIIGLGNIAAGLETWRGDRVDPALVWLARHGTDTTT